MSRNPTRFDGFISGIADDVETARVTPALKPLAVNATTAAVMLGLSRSQFFKLHASGKVPMPVRLGSRAPRWRVAELEAWLDAGCPDRRTWARARASRSP